MRLGPPLLKGGNVSCHLTPVCRFSAILCFLLWCLLFHEYSYVYFIWELIGVYFIWEGLLVICKTGGEDPLFFPSCDLRKATVLFV